MRTLLFAGKGGVGKTTVSAATGVVTSELEKKTLVMSVDPAHSLSDVFDTELAPKPVEVRENLYGMELDARHEMEKHWGEFREYLTSLLQFIDLEGVKATEMATFPGMEEVSSLLNLKRLEEDGEFEVVVMDLAPTASATRLLSMPDVLEWYMNRIFPVERKVMNVARPILGRSTSAPLPEDEVYGEAERLNEKLKAVKETLTDPEKSTARLVLTPDKMAIRETRRLFTHLNIFEFPIDAVIVNEIRQGNGNSSQLRKRQKEYLDQIEKSFAPIPVFGCERLDEELVGVEPLERAGRNLWNGEDPTEMYRRTKPFDITEEEEGYTLEVELPFSEKADLNLLERRGELVIEAGWYRRNIFLPRALRNLSPERAKFEKGKLRIEFR